MKGEDTPRGRQLQDSISRKLDPGLRRLLKLEDDEIQELVRADTDRLIKAKSDIAAEFAPLELAAAPQDRDAVARVRRLREKTLRSHPLLQPVRRHPLPPHGTLTPVEPLAPPRVRGIVRFAGNRRDLEDLGLEVRAQAQDIFTVTGSPAQLLALAGQPACNRIRAPRLFYPLVADACAQAEIDAAREPPYDLSGAGVLVGIADSELDVTHHGFRDPLPTGTHGTRVLYYWVQQPRTLTEGVHTDPPGLTPEDWCRAEPENRPDFTGLNYGRLYTRADIDVALESSAPYGADANQICCEPSEGGEHGTHCAGIAVGSGHEADWDAPPTYIGAAPAAGLVYVCIGEHAASFDLDARWEDELLDALDFMFRVADFEDRPMSVSVSQGSNFGPHNGSSEFDHARDNLLNSHTNRSIAWAAGNDNNAPAHWKATIRPGAVDSFMVRPKAPGSWAEVWYECPDELDYQIVYSPGGPTSRVEAGWRLAGEDSFTRFGDRFVEVGRDLDSGGDLRGIRVFFGNSSLGTRYTVELRNPHDTEEATYHVWMGAQARDAELGESYTGEYTLCDPACARSILTVGACQKAEPVPDPAVGERIAQYSGAGPTLDGRIKPELVAVGGSFYTWTDPDSWSHPVVSAKSDRNSGYVASWGTSMAAPVVAGATALLFEAYGAQGMELNQDTIKQLLTRHADRQDLGMDPSLRGYSCDPHRYGYGRLRLLDALDLIRPPTDVDVWIRTASDDYGAEPYPGECFCASPDIRVCHAGTDDETTHIRWNTNYDVKVTVNNLGGRDANSALLSLVFTVPHAAPSTWLYAEDEEGHLLMARPITVEAMDSTEHVFQWHPRPTIYATTDETHFCLLAEIDHADDRLEHHAPVGGSTDDAWAAAIKGTNNIALRNLHID